MKKGILCVVVFALTLCMAIGVSALTPAADGYVYNIPGDVNGDSELTLRDALSILRGVISGKIENADAADANQDGKVTAMDAAKVMQVLAGQAELEKTPIAEYYPISYLENFKEETITLTSETSLGTATSAWSAKYTDNGVMITVHVADSKVYTVAGNIGKSDNIFFSLHPVNAIAYFDKMALEFRVNAEGADAAILRYNYSKSGHVAENPANMTVKNDNFYYLYEKTNGGWKVTVFVSYDFMGVPKEYAYGNVRILPGMRNSDSDSVTTRTVYLENGIVSTRVDTWLVVDTDNTFIRDDFDSVSFAEDIPDGNAYKSCDFINHLASISSSTANSALRSAKIGASLFADRVYGFEQTALPTELVGKSYVCGPIAGSAVTVEKSGYVVLLVSGLSNYSATNQKILNAGWDRVLFAAKTPCNIAVTEDIHDSSNWYVKYCQAGETINFGKWVVVFGAAGATEPFAWESNPGIISTNTADPMYSFSSRVWQGIPTGEVTNGGRLLAGWNSGDVGEGKAGNYAILAYSDDNGKTWKEGLYVEGPESADGTKTATVCDVQIWLDKDTNTLYVFYLMSSTMNRFEKSSAVWMFTITNPDAPISQWKISESTYVFPGLLRNNITVLSDGTWLAAPNSYMDDRYTVVYASNDKGKTWTLRGSAYIPRARNYDETVITELTDGTLWMTVRANTSSDTKRKIVYQSFSFDKGETWTVSSETDIFHCTTRFNITRLPSGALLMVYNAASGRTKMTAALSYDDGKTWAYSLVLYTANSTYPDVSVDAQNNIHIFFDSQRYQSQYPNSFGSVFHVSLTEEYIKANNGKTLSASMLDIISKCK